MSGVPDDEASGRTDGGSSLVEFIAAATFAVLLLLALVQVALYAYAGNVARHAAHEGARAGAERGRAQADGAKVAAAILGDDLGGTGRRFTVRAATAGGRSTVDVTGEAPRLLPFAPGLPVHGHSEVPLE